MFTHAKKFFTESKGGAFVLGATCVAVPGGIYFHHEHSKWAAKATDAFNNGFTKGEAGAKSEAEKAIAEIRAAMEKQHAEDMDKVKSETKTLIDESYQNGFTKGAADAMAQIKGQIIVALTQQYKDAGADDATAAAQALAQANAMFPTA